MVHLSVAVARFVEALFWAIARAVGIVAGTGLMALFAAGAAFVVLRALWRRRRPRR